MLFNLPKVTRDNTVWRLGQSMLFFSFFFSIYFFVCMCVCFCFDLLLLAPRLPLYENCVQKNVNSCPLFTMFVRFRLF